MTFFDGLALAFKILPWAAAGVFALMWRIKRTDAANQRERADNAESDMAAANADNARKTAALRIMADNMEKLKDEKMRINKSDLDGLIAHAHELSDDAGESTGDSGGGDTDTGSDVISGRIVDG